MNQFPEPRTKPGKSSPRLLIAEAHEGLAALTVTGLGNHPVPIAELVTGRPKLPEASPTSRKKLLQALSADYFECEPRYFTSVRTLLPEICRKDVVRSLVTQLYFNVRDFPRFMLACPELKAHAQLLKSLGVGQIRTRCTATDGALDFSLSVKARISSKHPESKIEIPVALDAEKFLFLAAFADAGTVQKLRYSIPGFIYPEGTAKHPRQGPRIAVFAEADILLAVGNPPLRVRRGAGRFALVEVDVKTIPLLSALRNGYHSFPFLRPELDLHLRSTEDRAPLRMVTLASEGFTEAAAAAAERLGKELSRLLRKEKRKNKKKD